MDISPVGYRFALEGVADSEIPGGWRIVYFYYIIDSLLLVLFYNFAICVLNFLREAKDLSSGGKGGQFRSFGWGVIQRSQVGGKDSV